MVTRLCECIKLEMPIGFPCEEWTSFSQSISPKMDASGIDRLLSYVANGWNAIPWRYRAFAEADESFRVNLHANDTFEERYAQENALFAFHAAGVSIVECYAFALSAVTEFMSGRGHKFSQPGFVTNMGMRSLRERVDARFGSDPFKEILDLFFNDPMWKKLFERRHIFTHRGAPPRGYWVGGPKHGTAELKLAAHDQPEDVLVSDALTADIFAWLTRELGVLVKEGESFALRHLS